MSLILQDQRDHDLSSDGSDEDSEPGNDSDDILTSIGTSEESLEDELNSLIPETKAFLWRIVVKKHSLQHDL